VKVRARAAPVDNFAGQLDAAAAGAELLELEPEPLDDEELDLSDDFSDDDFSDDEALADSELLEEPLDELLADAVADSRLSVR
jgi:hypothetical protein